ncbi:carbohydrate ABC transporter permease, partial [Clostridium sp.]
WNSVKIVVLSVGGQLLFGIPAAWGFARYEFPFKKTLFTIYIVVMLMPFQVTMLSSYLVLDKLHLLNTHGSIILPAIFSTFSVFIMYRFFCNIPESIIESARIDGASEFIIFVKIGIPLGMPGIMSAVVLQFLEYWNLIEQPLTFLKDKALWPLSIYLPNITLENADIAFTASAVTLIAAIIVFFAGQSYLEQGIAASAVKE